MNQTVYVKAEVVRRQEDVLTLKLDDGFATQEVRVHAKNVLVMEPVEGLPDIVLAPGSRS